MRLRFRLLQGAMNVTANAYTNMPMESPLDMWMQTQTQMSRWKPTLTRFESYYANLIQIKLY